MTTILNDKNKIINLKTENSCPTCNPQDFEDPKMHKFHDQNLSIKIILSSIAVYCISYFNGYFAIVDQIVSNKLVRQ